MIIKVPELIKLKREAEPLLSFHLRHRALISWFKIDGRWYNLDDPLTYDTIKSFEGKNKEEMTAIVAVPEATLALTLDLVAPDLCHLN